MNIQRWKGMIWLASLGAGGTLVFAVVQFLQNKDQLAREIPVEHLAEVLDSVPEREEQTTDVVDYYSGIQRTFHKLDWTGKPPPPPPPPPVPGVTKAPVVPVSKLLDVVVVKEDSDPKLSLAYVKYVDGKLTAHNTGDREDRILRPGKRLFSPFENVKVDSITAEGVVFAFDDPERQKETVAPPSYTLQGGGLGLVFVAPGGVLQPERTSRLVNAPAGQTKFQPGKTMQVRKNEFQIGTQSLAELDEDYSRILSRDVRYSTYKNPRTGASEGLKVNYVAPGSLPEQHGLTEGEVIKSINGHRVTSVNDAVAYVKANADSTDTWTVLFEKQGREFTRTYYSPNE